MNSLTAPNTESCNISRDHLTASEVKQLIEVVKSQGGWYSYRNSTLILMLYRHGLRRSEAARLRWSDIDLSASSFVFIGNRHTPLSERTISHIVHQAGELAGFDFTVHAHLLRHACGYYLANKGVDTRTIQDYLGHANIQNTVRYTQLSSARFEGLWD